MTELCRHVTRDAQRTILRKIQGDKCGACGAEGGNSLRLDHDHETGQTRGLLCNVCNLAEGNGAGEELEDYLANPPALIFGWEYQDNYGRWGTEIKAAMGHLNRHRMAAVDEVLADLSWSEL